MSQVANYELEANRLAIAFDAHANVKNVGAMRSTLRGLRRAELQASLVKRLGGTNELNFFFFSCSLAVNSATEAKARNRRVNNKA